MNRWSISLLLLVVLLAGVAYAEEDTIEATPPAADINPFALDLASRAALVKAVEFYRTRATNDVDGWVAPPIRNRKVVDHKEVLVKYSKKTIDRKIPIYEYEDVKTYKNVKVGDSVSAVTVRKEVMTKRVKGIKGYKTVKEERLVHDPNGSINKYEKRPVYGPGGPDQWRYGRLGINALAAYAMLKAGVSTDDPVLSRLMSNLSNFLDSYGCPDGTWDLAWMTAAFSAWPGDRYRTPRKVLPSKLLDGQIKDGPGRGLWGPSSLHVDVFVAGLKHEQSKAKILLAVKEDARKEEIQNRLSAFLYDMSQVSMVGRQFKQIDSFITLAPAEAEKVQVMGLTEYIYNQRAGDLESTAVALLALRQAAESGVLPENTWRPLNDRKQPIFAPESSSAVLARAANALAARQQADGSWDECNLHQPVAAFNGFDYIEGLPANRASFKPLASKKNFLTSVQGYSGLASIGRGVGVHKLMGRFGKNVAAATKNTRTLAETFIDGEVKVASVGGYVPPYDACLFVAGASQKLGTGTDDRRDLWMRLAYVLLQRQDEDGAWGRVPKRRLINMIPTSMRARMEAMPELPLAASEKVRAEARAKLGRAGGGGGKLDRSQAHVRFVGKTQKRQLPQCFASEPELVGTAFGMLALTAGIRPPVAGDCSWSDAESSGSIVLPMVISVMQKNTGVSVRGAAVSKDLKLAEIGELPAFFLRGSGAFTPTAEMKESLKAFLESGVVIVETDAGTEGKAFEAAARAALLPLVPGGALVDLGKTEVVGELKDKVSVQGFKRKDESTAVVFLPVSSGAGQAGGLPVHVAAQVSYEVLLRTMDVGITAPNYPIDIEKFGEADLVLRSAKAGLIKRAAPPPAAPEATAEPMVPVNVPPEKAPAETQPAETKPAAPPKPKPAADEVW